MILGMMKIFFYIVEIAWRRERAIERKFIKHIRQENVFNVTIMNSKLNATQKRIESWSRKSNKLALKSLLFRARFLWVFHLLFLAFSFNVQEEKKSIMGEVVGVKKKEKKTNVGFEIS